MGEEGSLKKPEHGRGICAQNHSIIYLSSPLAHPQRNIEFFPEQKERGRFDVISGWGSRGLEGLAQGHQLVLETAQVP